MGGLGSFVAHISRKKMQARQRLGLSPQAPPQTPPMPRVQNWRCQGTNWSQCSIPATSLGTTSSRS